MTQDEIIKMAHQTSKEWLKEFPTPEETAHPVPKRFLEIFAKLVAEKEREACAQILANTDLGGLNDHPLQNWVAGMLFEYIKTIRARGQE